jgi:hypothetical protein
MNAKNTVKTVVAAILAVTLGMSGPALAGGKHYGGHGYSGGHGYKHHRGHGGYGRGHGYNRHRGYRGHRGYGHRYRPHYGYGGHTYRYYSDSDDDLLLGLLLGGFTGYALSHGHHR